MKFIFPQNYNFTNQLLGFIDYSTLFLNIIWGFFCYFFINIFNFSIYIKISIFIVLFFPILLFSIIGFNHEKILYILKYLFIFFNSPKMYLFKKY